MSSLLNITLSSLSTSQRDEILSKYKPSTSLSTINPIKLSILEFINGVMESITHNNTTIDINSPINNHINNDGNSRQA